MKKYLRTLPRLADSCPSLIKLHIGMEGIIDGWRWVQVEELTEDGTAWAVDQDGESYEVALADFDHIY